MGLFDFFKRAKKEQSINVPTPIAPGSTHYGKSIQQLLDSIGSPESYADLYEKQSFKQSAATARDAFENIAIPQALEASEGMGMGNSSLFRKEVGRRGTELSLGLGNLQGALREKGLGTGFSQETKKLGALEQLQNQELTQSNLGDNRRMLEALRIRGAAQARDQQQRSLFPKYLSAASTLAGGLGGFGGPGMGGGGTSQFGNLYGANTPWGVKDMGNYSTLPSVRTSNQGGNPLQALSNLIKGRR